MTRYFSRRRFGTLLLPVLAGLALLGTAAWLIVTQPVTASPAPPASHVQLHGDATPAETLVLTGASTWGRRIGAGAIELAGAHRSGIEPSRKASSVVRVWKVARLAVQEPGRKRTETAR